MAIETGAMRRRPNVFEWQEEIWNIPNIFTASFSSWQAEGGLIGLASIGVAFTKVALTGFFDGFAWQPEGIFIGLALTFGVAFTKVALTGFKAGFNIAIFANSLPFAKADFLDDDIVTELLEVAIEFIITSM